MQNDIKLYFRGRSTTEVFPVEGTDGADCFFGINQVGHDGYSHRNNPNQYRVYDPSGLSPRLNQMGGGGLEPHIIDLKYLYHEGAVRTYEGCSPALTSRDYKDPPMVTEDVGIEVIGKAYDRDNYGDNRNRVLGEGGCCPSLTATQHKEPYRIGLSLSEIQTRQAKG